MDLGLIDKVAMVSGAGAAGDGIGNGRAAALLLAREGCRVVCVDRDPALAEGTAEMIRAEGGDALALAGDATREDDCRQVVDATVAHYGGIDLLDNNVGVGSRGSILTDTPEHWHRVLRINLDSVFWMSRTVIPMMEARGGGAIVNVSSIAAMVPRGLTAYATSKGGVITLTQAMAVDHARAGIRVNCVAPGPVFTPMVAQEGMSEELRRRRVDATLLKIEGTGWDVGRAVVFLLSDAARYVTGQTLAVDGGVTLQGPGG